MIRIRRVNYNGAESLIWTLDRREKPPLLEMIRRFNYDGAESLVRTLDRREKQPLLDTIRVSSYLPKSFSMNCQDN